MDPISLAIAGVGLGMKLFGGLSGSSAQSKYSAEIAQISQSNSYLEQEVNSQRNEAMEMTGRRQQMEDYRNTQRARAKGLNASVNQGAQFGSGMAGGQAQAAAQGTLNAQGISNMMQTSNNIFGLDNSISKNNAQITALKGQMNSALASDKGIADLGSSLMSGANTLGNLGQDAMAGLNGLQLGSLVMPAGALSGGF